MLNEINEKLNKVKEDIATKKVLEKKLEEYKRQLEVDENELKELKESLEKEYKDVEKLEKLSFSNLLATILKNKEEKLEKEQQEYLMAKIKFDEQSSKVILAKENVESIKNRVFSLCNCENEYKILLEKKLNLIKNYGDTLCNEKLSRLESDMDIALKNKKEIEEAIAAGQALRREIKSAEDSLDSAKNWGIWDIAGGDLLSSIAKHNRINDAEDSFRRVSTLLRRFNKELGDINLESLNFSSTTIAFDIFFDNIFTDFAVQNKINDALNNVIALSNRVNTILNSLENQKNNLVTTINTRRREYEDIIENLK